MLPSRWVEGAAPPAVPEDGEGGAVADQRAVLALRAVVLAVPAVLLAGGHQVGLIQGQRTAFQAEQEPTNAGAGERRPGGVAGHGSDSTDLLAGEASA